MSQYILVNHAYKTGYIFSEVTLAKVAEAEKKRRPKFSVFDFLDTSKDTDITEMDDSISVSEETKIESKVIDNSVEKENEKPKLILSESNYDDVSSIIFRLQFCFLGYNVIYLFRAYNNNVKTH